MCVPTHTLKIKANGSHIRGHLDGIKQRESTHQKSKINLIKAPRSKRFRSSSLLPRDREIGENMNTTTLYQKKYVLGLQNTCRSNEVPNFVQKLGKLTAR